MNGVAHDRSLLMLSCDPDYPGFAAVLGTGALRRTAVHEAHHCLCMAGPGYGETLGEAIVSEGLAGCFTSLALGSPPEPWEAALEPGSARCLLPAAGGLEARDYDHAAWFFGTSNLPRWLGCALGHLIVGRWAAAAQPSGRAWVDVPAAEVLAVGARGL